VSAHSAKEMAGMVDTTMGLQGAVQDGEAWLRDDHGSAVQVEMTRALPAPG
jgi:hypothetical protein